MSGGKVFNVKGGRLPRAKVCDSFWCPSGSTAVKLADLFGIAGQAQRDLVQRFALASRRHKIAMIDPDAILLHVARHQNLLARQNEPNWPYVALPPLCRLERADQLALSEMIAALDGRRTAA